MPDTVSTTTRADLRVHVPSGLLTLRDGTSGGSPISGINYGIPDEGLLSQTVVPSGVEGFSLTAMRREFPEYTRIRNDDSSLGAQILAAASNMVDDTLIREQRHFEEQYVNTAPTAIQGVVQEWPFGEATDLHTRPAISGRLGAVWFDIPVTSTESLFWDAPPTRLETTSAEIEAVPLSAWTTSVSGVPSLLISGTVSMPLHNTIYIDVSGATTFTTTEDNGIVTRPLIEIHGRWAHDPIRPGHPLRYQPQEIISNGTIKTDSSWRSIEQVMMRNCDATTAIRISPFSWNAPWRADSVLPLWVDLRETPPSQAFWRLASSGTTFGDLVQPDIVTAPEVSEDCWMALCRLQTDTLEDEDLEWDVVDAWRMTSSAGVALSGIVDFIQIPDTRYLLLLDRDSSAWVFDTYRPRLDMSSYAETLESPIQVRATWPASSNERPASYSVKLAPVLLRTSQGFQRWRWIHHSPSSTLTLLEDGTTEAVASTTGWRVSPTVMAAVPAISRTIDEPGQHTFELEVVTDDAKYFRTYVAIIVVEKRAIARLPIRGLTAAPTAIDTDIHGRPWVLTGTTATRLVLRTDIAMWSADNKTLMTREPYDEVRR